MPAATTVLLLLRPLLLYRRLQRRMMLFILQAKLSHLTSKLLPRTFQRFWLTLLQTMLVKSLPWRPQRAPLASVRRE